MNKHQVEFIQDKQDVDTFNNDLDIGRRYANFDAL